LEHAWHGEESGCVDLLSASHLARFFLAAASRRNVQTLDRSAVCRESTRYRGANLDPPDKALVICVDEKSQIQALDRTQPLLPMRPGQVERRTHDYKRHGTTTLFAGLIAAVTAETHVKAGSVIGKCMPRHRAQEFRKFLDEVERNVPTGLGVHVILDNASSHKTRLIRNWFARRPH
jgi:transposase